MIIRLNDITVALTESFLIKIKEYTQDIGKKESGGILLGGYIQEQNKYVITEASVPNGNDKRGPAFFIRDYKRAQKIIDKCWSESEGTINYLGEWHTHGCKNPQPSITDKELLKMIISDESNVWNEIFMLILGRNNTFYLGMADVNSEGVIIAEIIVKEDGHAHVLN